MSFHASKRPRMTIAVLALLVATQAHGQTGPHSAAEINAEFHMEMTLVRKGTAADSAKAAGVAAELRVALAKYKDTTAAVKDGYRMFMPENKHQQTYHFTNNWHAVQEAFRFDPAKPTSLLYKQDSLGHFVLLGAMYTAPKRWGYDKLNDRVPLSIARWHKHVNWCLPKKGDDRRWVERKDGQSVFGPESPIATKAACDVVGGRFEENVFGWMIHANVFAGSDPMTIWGDDHMAHDAHAGMKMDGM